MFKFLRHTMNITSHTGPLAKFPNHLAITPGVDVNGVWVGAVEDLIKGDLRTWANAAAVKSIRVPGYWLHKKGETIKVASPPQTGEKIVYALHGGAYTSLSAHPTDPTAPIALGLLEHVGPGRRVFSVEYRLSSGKPFKVANPFPTALIDALAGYSYLVNVVGFSPKDIILEGDSAGGNLAHALTRYLVQNHGQISLPSPPGTLSLPAPPGALLLLSPWCDLGNSHEHLPEASVKTCGSSDYIANPSDGGFDYARTAFLGPHGKGFAEYSPYVSPASRDPSMNVDFKRFPRTFIVAGGAEILLDQIRTLKTKMIADLGEGDGIDEGEGKVRYYEAPDAVHDYLVFPWHDPERTETLKAIAKWVARHDQVVI